MASENNRSPKALHVQVAEQLIEQLKKGTAPWQKPWSSGGVPAFQLPFNAVTGNRYKGINSLALLVSNYEDPRWATYKQAAANGWQVKRGEKGKMIQYVKLAELHTKRDKKGRAITGSDGKPLKEKVPLRRPIITTAWVFNAGQMDGIPPLKVQPLRELAWDPIERAEQLVRTSGVRLHHKGADTAYYDRMADAITMPLREQFETAGRYYSILLHEMGHWTGHPTRLDRNLANVYGSDDYAREELRAEIASLLIGEEFHIGHDPAQHASYVNSWIRILEDHPFEIHAAAADAEKIFNYMVGLEQKRQIKTGASNPGSHPFRLEIGDAISYKGRSYLVLKEDPACIVEDQGSGRQIRLQKDDGLYRSLVQRKVQLLATDLAQGGPSEKIEAAEVDQRNVTNAGYRR